jgi:hypothetical protein
MFCVGAWACARLRHDVSGRVSGAALVLVPAMLGNLLCWDHHLVVLALLLAPLAARWLQERQGRAAFYFAGLTLFLICNLVFWPRDYFVFLVIVGVPTLGVVTAWCTLLVAGMRREMSAT